MFRVEAGRNFLQGLDPQTSLRERWNDTKNSQNSRELPNKDLLGHIEYWHHSFDEMIYSSGVKEVLIQAARCTENEVIEMSTFNSLSRSDKEEVIKLLRFHGEHGNPSTQISVKIAEHLIAPLRQMWNDVKNSRELPNKDLLGHIEYWHHSFDEMIYSSGVKEVLIQAARCTENEVIEMSTFNSLSRSDKEEVIKLLRFHGEHGNPPSNISARIAEDLSRYMTAHIHEDLPASVNREAADPSQVEMILELLSTQEGLQATIEQQRTQLQVVQGQFFVPNASVTGDENMTRTLQGIIQQQTEDLDLLRAEALSLNIEHNPRFFELQQRLVQANEGRAADCLRHEQALEYKETEFQDRFSQQIRDLQGKIKEQESQLQSGQASLETLQAERDSLHVKYSELVQQLGGESSIQKSVTNARNFPELQERDRSKALEIQQLKERIRVFEEENVGGVGGAAGSSKEVGPSKPGANLEAEVTRLRRENRVLKTDKEALLKSKKDAYAELERKNVDLEKRNGETVRQMRQNEAKSKAEIAKLKEQLAALAPAVVK